jgi:hypothetical protein
MELLSVEIFLVLCLDYLSLSLCCLHNKIYYLKIKIQIMTVILVCVILLQSLITVFVIEPGLKKIFSKPIMGDS